MNSRQLLRKAAASPHNLRFADFVTLIEAFGFQLQRVTGSHYMFFREGIPSVVNVQEQDGQAKAYQVRQFLKLIERYELRLED